MRSAFTMLVLFAPTTMVAQARWSLGVEVGGTTYSAAAHDTSVDQVHLRPGYPTIYTVRLARESDRFGVALGVGFASSEWAVNIDDFRILTGDGLALFEIAPEVSARIARTSAGATLRVHTGPIFDVWVPSGEDPRQRLGAQLGLALALPLAQAWKVTIRSDMALSRSFLNEDEESAAVRRDGTMRRGRLALGITRRL